MCLSGSMYVNMCLCDHVCVSTSVSQVPNPGSPMGCTSYKIKMVKDEGGLVHLAQDEQHFIINELLELFQVAVHLLLQLIADLWVGQSRSDGRAELSRGDLLKQQPTSAPE